MSKGVIVQLDQDMAHILKNDGAFVSCPRDIRWQVGDVITISRHPMFSLKAILIACGIFLCLFAGTGIAIYQIPATYIEVSVNPSIQLTMNRFDKVLSVTGLNADGDALLEGVSYKSLNLDEAYARLLNRLENNGYLTDATLQLIIVNNSQKTIDRIEQNLRGTSEKYGQINNIQISIKRYANDEYLSLEHPLPIMAIPKESSQNPPEQQAELPSNDAPSSSESEAPSESASEVPSSHSEETPSAQSSKAPSSGSPSSSQSEVPSSQSPSPPSNTPNNDWHNGNWHNGDWRNGWYDWDCGW